MYADDFSGTDSRLPPEYMALRQLEKDQVRYEQMGVYRNFPKERFPDQGLQLKQWDPPLDDGTPWGMLPDIPLPSPENVYYSKQQAPLLLRPEMQVESEPLMPLEETHIPPVPLEHDDYQSEMDENRSHISVA